eukprot:5692425-Prymnesium_polylepis.1
MSENAAGLDASRTLSSAPSTSRLRKCADGIPAASMMEVSGWHGTSVCLRGRLARQCCCWLASAPPWTLIDVTPFDVQTAECTIAAWRPLRRRASKFVGFASMRRPDQLKHLSRTRVLLALKPSNAPSSTNMPGRPRARRSSSGSSSKSSRNCDTECRSTQSNRGGTAPSIGGADGDAASTA